MHLDLNKKIKVMYIWLSKEEQSNIAIQSEIDILVDKLQKKKYRIVIFKSGEQDLVTLTQSLIITNKHLP